MKTKRCSGILLPISSLPAPYGIGTLGKPAHDFLAFLKEAGQSVWQMLPLAQTGFGDSPYQSCSAFAGNPYLIDFDMLAAKALLDEKDYAEMDFGSDDAIDYEKLYIARYAVLRKAFEKFSEWYPDDYYRFCYEEGWWLEDYALYMTAKQLNGNTSYLEWPEPQRNRAPEAIVQMYLEQENEVNFWKFCQYELSLQWTELKTAAKKMGIEIMGDIPIYVAADSADAWAHPELFLFDEKGLPVAVAGCPPDYFAQDGQLWGNPLYNWDYHEKTHYNWWITRLRHALRMYDRVRIDHFRAFDTYYAIPYGAKTAKNGTWENGPGIKLFDAIKQALGEVNIVAEDLGELFESVRVLLAQTGFPGMKVLQFAFDPNCDSEYLPHNHVRNCVVYPGTHDNTTVVDWLATLEEKTREKAVGYLSLNQEEGYAQGILRAALASVADLCVIPMADWLMLDAQGRINTPSTLGGTNWTWRLKKSQLSPALAESIAAKTALYGRMA